MSEANEARSPRGFQFSLLKLLLVTGWAAIVCIALKTPTPAWAAAVFLLTLLAALAGGLGILYRTGRARAFAVGFFAGCFGYGACLFVTEKHFGGQFGNENEMPTTQMANWLFGKLHPDSINHYGSGGMGGSGLGPGATGGGGFGGGGGMGGGGFFSVDSSLSADQEAATDPEDSGGGESAAGAPPDSAGNMAGGEGAGSADGMGPASMPGAGGMPGGPGPPALGAPMPTIYFLKHFVAIVHSALAVLLGLAGGVIAQIFHAKRR